MNKKILPLVAFFATFFAFAQTPCENGIAAGYPCDGYALLSHISLGQMNALGKALLKSINDSAKKKN